MYVACLASQGFTFIANDYVGFPSRLHNIYSFTFDDDKKIISHFIDNSRDPETRISNPAGDFLDIMWYDSTHDDFTVFYASKGPGVWTGPLEPAPIPIPATGPLLIVALGALGALLRNTRRTVQAD